MATRYQYRTPGTRLWWSGVAEWVAVAQKIDRRRLSHRRNAALKAHGGCMPRALIDIEDDLDAIEEALYLLKYGPTGLARPLRGARGDAPQTRIIMDLMNRRARLMAELDEVPEGGNWRAMHPS